MNPVVEAFRARSRNGYEGKSDDELTLLIADKYPDLLPRYLEVPGFKNDYLKLKPTEPNEVGQFSTDEDLEVAKSVERQSNLAADARRLKREQEDDTIGKMSLRSLLGVLKAGKGLKRAGGGILNAIPTPLATAVLAPGLTGPMGLTPATAPATRGLVKPLSEAIALSGDIISDEGKREYAELSEEQEQLGGGLPTKIAEMIAETAGSSAPSLLGALTPLGRKGAGLIASTQTFGSVFADAFDEYRKTMPEEEARRKALTPALIGGAVTLGATSTFGGLEGMFEKLAAGQLTKVGVKKILNAALKATLLEFPEEGLDQLSQGIVEKFTYNPKKEWPSILKEALIAGALGSALGIIGGGAAGGIKITAEKVSDKLGGKRDSKEQIPLGTEESQGQILGPLQVEEAGAEERAPSGLVQEPPQEVAPAPGPAGERLSNAERRVQEAQALTISEPPPVVPPQPRPTDMARLIQQRSQSAPGPEPVVTIPAIPTPEVEPLTPGPMGPFPQGPKPTPLGPPAPTVDIPPAITSLISSVHAVASNPANADEGLLYGALEAAPVVIRQLESIIGKLESLSAHDKAEPLYAALNDIDKLVRTYQNRPVPPRVVPDGPEAMARKIQERSRSRPVTRPSQMAELIQRRSSTGAAATQRSIRGLLTPEGRPKATAPTPAPPSPVPAAPRATSVREINLPGVKEAAQELQSTLGLTEEQAVQRLEADRSSVPGMEIRRFREFQKRKLLEPSPGAPVTADPNQAQVRDILTRNAGNAQAALRELQEAGLFTGLNASIVEDLLKLPAPPVRVVLESSDAEKPGAFGSYSSGVIRVFEPAFTSGSAQATFLHEYLHALTLNLDPASQEYQTLTAIFVEAMDAARLSGDKFYGLNNIDEFLAEAHSNPAFQDFLANVKTGGKSLWERFIDWIKKLFKIRNRGALAEVLKATKPIIAQATGAAQGKAYSLSQANRILEQTRLSGTPEEIANATENVRRQQAAQATATLPQVQESVADLHAIVEQKNQRGDVRITGPALQRLRVVQAVLANSVVKKHLVGPVMTLEESTKGLGVAMTTFQDIKNDPSSSPQLISSAAGEAAKNLDAFYGDVMSFRRGLDQQYATLEEKLALAIEKSVEETGAATALDALVEDFVVMAQAFGQVTKERGSLLELKVLTDSNNRSAVSNVLGFVAANLNLAPIETGKVSTTDQVVQMIKVAAAPFITQDIALDQVIGASQGVVRSVAQFLLRSSAIRGRINEGKDFITGKTHATPLSPFKIKLAQEMKAGRIKSALRLFATGVGKNSIELARSRKAAQFYATKERDLLVELEALQQARDLIDGVEQSPAFRAQTLEIYRRIGTMDKIRSIEGDVIILEPHYFGEEPTRLDGTGNKGAEKLKKLRDWLTSGLAYIMNDKHPEWDPARVAAIEQVAHNEGLFLDPSINPLAGKMMEGLPRAAMRSVLDFFFFHSGKNKVPKFLTDILAGAEAEVAIAGQVAYSSAQELKQSIAKENTGKLGVVTVRALRSHMMNEPDWKKKVQTYLAASLQSFNNPKRLKVGSITPTGHEITQEDMDQFILNKHIEGDTIDSMNGLGERQLKSIQVVPHGVRFERNGKQAFRLPFEQGPGTVHRRLSSLTGLALQWSATSTKQEKIDFLNKNLDQILIGYVYDVINPDFNFTYRYYDAFKAIALDPRNPIQSFQDLAQRVYENTMTSTTEDVTSVEEAEDEILREVGENFKKFQTFRGTPSTPEKALLIAWGGETAFNTERGVQIVPSAWYDYGITTLGEFAGFLHNSTAGFAIDYYYGMRLLEKALRAEVAEKAKLPAESFLKRMAGLSESRKLQIAGDEFYNRGELEVFLDDVTKYNNNLLTALQYQVSDRNMAKGAPGDLMGDFIRGTFRPNAYLNFVVQSLMAMPTTQALNATGGAMQLMLFDIVVRRKSALAQMAKLIPLTARTLYRETLHLLPKSAAKVLGDARYTPLIGPLIEVISEPMLKAVAEADLQKKLGGDLNMDIWNILRSEWGQFPEGTQITSETEAAYGNRTDEFGRLLSDAAEVLRQTTMGYVDGRINSRAEPLIDGMRSDLEERAIRYGQMREQRARLEGRDPFDITDLRNRFSDKELVGGRIPKIGDSAHRLRDFIRREGKANLDYEMWQFYKRWLAAGKPGATTKNAMKPEDRLFGDKAVWNQLVMALSKDINLATFDTRPIGGRTGKLGAVVSIFANYSGWAGYKLTSIADRESRKSWSKNQADNLSTVIGAILFMTMVGALNQWLNDEAKKLLFNRVTPQPNAFSKQTPASRVKSILSSFAGMMAVYGTVINNITGRVFRRGFDLDSAILVVNGAQDIQNALRESWQTNDPIGPTAKLAARWTFPLNVISPRLEYFSGVNEVTQARNLLTKGARAASLDTETEVVRPSSQGRGDVTYTRATPLVNAFVNAVGNKKRAEAVEAFDALVKLNKENTGGDYDKAAEKAGYQLQAKFPIKQVFKQDITQDQYELVLKYLSPEEKAKLVSTLDTFDDYLRANGIKEVPRFVKPERTVPRAAPDKTPAYLRSNNPQLTPSQPRGLRGLFP